MPGKLRTHWHPREILPAAEGTAVFGPRRMLDWRKLTVWLAMITGPWAALVMLVRAFL